MNTAELSSMSKQVRRDIINMTANAGSGHPGGSLSAADLMTCLFSTTCMWILSTRTTPIGTVSC